MVQPLARYLLYDVNCDAYKTCLASQVMIPTNGFIYLKVYYVTEQSLTYSKRLAETVGTSVTLMKSMMAQMAHLNLMEQHITAAFKNTVYFEWTGSTDRLLHQQIVDGIVRGVTGIYIS
jgi:hypothetical protein